MTPSFAQIARSSLAAGLTLAVVGAGLILAGSQSTASADESASKGQLTRRGLSGTVLGTEGPSIVVETRFGNVTVGTAMAEVSFPGPAPDEGEGDRQIEVGDRVGILLDRSPVASTSTPIFIGDGDTAATSTPPGPPGDDNDDPPAPSFRDVKALRITVIPSKATRSHLRGVLKESANGRFKILRGDGTEEEFDGPPGLVGAAGDDLLFIVRQGPGGGPKEITNTVSEDEIIDRLEALEAAAEDNPELAESLSRLRGKVNDRRLQRLEALVASSDPEDQDLISGAVTRARGKSENKGGGSSGDGDGAGDQDQGSGNAGGGGASSSGVDNPGGGGKPGNQGGGPKT